jgi:glycosyltransferase involved in cell wall biosynthesis
LSSLLPQIETLSGCNPLILVGYLSLGGSERQGYLLARALREHGMRPGVIVWTLTSEDFLHKHIQEINVPMVIAPQQQGAWIKVSWLRSLVRQVRPSVLHSMTFFLNSAAAWAAQGLPVIAVGSIRGDYRFEAKHGTIHYAINRRWPETIITNSRRAWQQALTDRSFFRPKQPLFVPNALDLAPFSGHLHRKAKSPEIIGVGSLYPSKRWDRLLRAIARLVASRPELPFRLNIVGRYGSERGNLERLAHDLNLQDRVSFLGLRPDIPELLSQSDIFAFTSDSEGTPNAVMEAMAAGLPVVSTDCGDVSRLVVDGVTGFVVPREKEHCMVSALADLLCDSNLRARMGEAGRAKAQAEFSLNKLATGMLDAYSRAGWKQA